MSSQSKKQMIARKIDTLYEMYYTCNEMLITFNEKTNVNIDDKTLIINRMNEIRTQINVYKRDIETITNNDRIQRVEQRLFTSTIK